MHFTRKNQSCNCKLRRQHKQFYKYKNVYFQNPICSLIPLYHPNQRKQNIVSTCLFRMRKGSYKNFNRYVNGIFHLSNSLQDSFKLRLFIDYSIYNDVNLFNRIANIRNIQIVLYKCKYFSISKYHLGVFGTIMRLFNGCCAEELQTFLHEQYD